MTLEDVRRELRERAGGIKGWALHRNTFLSIASELGVDGISPGSGLAVTQGAVPVDCKLFDAPVVFVWGTQPEGVIV